MVESFIVCVGDEAKEFVVIQSIATRSSKFFQAAMTRDWKEALEKRVMLPGTKVSVFEAYLHGCTPATSPLPKRVKTTPR